MASQPNPPLSTDSIEELADHVCRNPTEWMLYLRNMSNYAAILESKTATLHATTTDLETVIAKRDAIIQYQEEQYRKELDSNQKKIIQLEVEKTQLLAAATPAVYTPPTESVPEPKPAAEQPADAAPRPTTLAPAARSDSSHLSEKLPDPKEFDGTRNDLRRFTQQIYGKMKANADRFPTATARLTYIAGRLTGKAYDLILPKTVYGVPEFVDYPEMLKYLEDAFGDPDRVQNAQNKLYQLKQKNLDFSVYFSEFQRLALEGEMPEDALTPLLFQGISRELQDMLLHNPSPSRKYRDYANHLQGLDNRYRQHQQQVARTRNPTTPRPATSYAATTRPTTTASETPRHVQSPRPEWRNQRPASPPATGGDPMDLSAQKKFVPNGRRERGECFRCGSKTHRVASCPEPDTRPRSQLHYSHLYRPDSPNSSRSASPPPSVTQSVNGVSLS
jgi:hypothetical protein